MAKHGKTKKYAKQHFVPQCYTKPWCDPDIPSGSKMTPYVWQFDRDGTNPRRKAPVNLFTETDIYTIHLPDGERDLRLEHGLQELEDKFTRIRNRTFSRNVWPEVNEMVWVLAFVATIQARTQAMRNFHREQWGDIRQKMEAMQAHFEKATAEQRKAEAAISRLSDTGKRGMTIEDVRRLEAEPIQQMIEPVLRTVLPILGRMSIAVLCTDNPIGFVTTDDPCTWYDPEAYKRPPLYRNPGLGMRSIEVTLPISPRQCLLITHNPTLQGFIEVEEALVSNLNMRHIGHCDESFITCRNEVRGAWFEVPPLPDDAWENARARQAASEES
jgi:hypothetical protein